MLWVPAVGELGVYEVQLRTMFYAYQQDRESKELETFITIQKFKPRTYIRAAVL